VQARRSPGNRTSVGNQAENTKSSALKVAGAGHWSRSTGRPEAARARVSRRARCLQSWHRFCRVRTGAMTWTNVRGRQYRC